MKTVINTIAASVFALSASVMAEDIDVAMYDEAYQTISGNETSSAFEYLPSDVALIDLSVFNGSDEGC